MTVRRIDNVYTRFDEDDKARFLLCTDKGNKSCGWVTWSKVPYPDNEEIPIDEYIQLLEDLAFEFYHDMNVYKDAYTEALADKTAKTEEIVKLIKQLDEPFSTEGRGWKG